MSGIRLDAGAVAVNKTVSLTLGNLYPSREERKQHKGDLGAPKQVIFLPRGLKVFSIQLRNKSMNIFMDMLTRNITYRKKPLSSSFFKMPKFNTNLS